jgi:exosortase
MPVVLGVLGWQVWVWRRQLAEQAGAPSSWGVGLLVIAMLVYYVGILAVQPRLTVFSFVLVLYSLALALGGRPVARVLFFPISFLILMVPLNFLEERIGVPLRHVVAQMSTALLNTLGIETVRVGTAIHSSVFKFDVADPCSGTRSLMALTTVTAAYAYVTQTAQWKRWVLFLSAMPLAVLGNIARVTSIALVAQVYGQELATKAYHDWSGYLVFGVALSAMVGVGALLNVRYRRLWQRWNQPPAATSAPMESPL